MRHTNLLLLLMTIATLSACVKAGKEVAEELGIVPSSCGTDGARIEAQVDDASFCADGQIVALSDGHTATITGLGLLGSSLSLELDTLEAGTYPINEARNAIMYMSLGTPYTSMADQPGTLTISGHDVEGHRLKAHFEATLRNEMSGGTKAISGSVDVTYTIGE
ncbi:MAG TPA: hypothetical protein PLB89_00835 [Flavobacteriales bacterium]|nr:hypothetical protein [Flavobacteriales bacterium]